MLSGFSSQNSSGFCELLTNSYSSQNCANVRTDSHQRSRSNVACQSIHGSAHASNQSDPPIVMFSGNNSCRSSIDASNLSYLQSSMSLSGIPDILSKPLMSSTCCENTIEKELNMESIQEHVPTHYDATSESIKKRKSKSKYNNISRRSSSLKANCSVGRVLMRPLSSADCLPEVQSIKSNSCSIPEGFVARQVKRTEQITKTRHTKASLLRMHKQNTVSPRRLSKRHIAIPVKVVSSPVQKSKLYNSVKKTLTPTPVKKKTRHTHKLSPEIRIKKSQTTYNSPSRSNLIPKIIVTGAATPDHMHKKTVKVLSGPLAKRRSSIGMARSKRHKLAKYIY